MFEFGMNCPFKHYKGHNMLASKNIGIYELSRSRQCFSAKNDKIVVLCIFWPYPTASLPACLLVAR